MPQQLNEHKKLYQKKVLHLQVKKSLFLLVGVTINGCSLVLYFAVRNFSAVEAVVIAPFSFNKDSTSQKLLKL